MIEDYIMDTLTDWKTSSVSSVIRSAVVDLGCTLDEAQDAIINLENQGRVKGRIDKEEQAVLIELACPCDTCRFSIGEGCQDYGRFFDSCVEGINRRTDICNYREAEE